MAAKADSLINDTAWLSQVSTLVSATKSCSSKALEGVDVPEFISQEEARQAAVEVPCISALTDPKVAKILNAKTYLAFEKKLKEFEEALAKTRKEWRENCGSSPKVGLMSCLSRLWPKVAEDTFDRWSGLEENREFKNQKGLFIMRATNNSSNIKRKIKRGIASERGE